MSKDMSQIVLDHGTGGLLSQDLVTSIINPILSDIYLGKMEDSAILELPNNNGIAMTTDSFVIDPIFFGNGNIGKISVCGTVNDLAVSGATPLFLTLGLVMEEGFLISDLKKILGSIHTTAKEANIYMVAGDTKVVKKGEVDKIFINTSGIGIFESTSVKMSLDNIQDKDDIIVTGYIGNHSIHILSMREGLGYENIVKSDCAPLNKMIKEITQNSHEKIHSMRDLTRGGLGSALNEIASAINMGITIDISKIPLQHEAKMAAEMLGINPMYLANEGNICIFCSPDESKGILNLLHKNEYGRNAAVIGNVSRSSNKKQVIGIDSSGNSKLIECLYGVELPRLC